MQDTKMFESSATKKPTEQNKFVAKVDVTVIKAEDVVKVDTTVNKPQEIK